MITTIGDIVRGDRAVFPPYLYAAYQSTIRRAPNLALVDVPLTLSELTGPGPVISAVTPEDADLTRNAGTGGEAIGQRIIVDGACVRRAWRARATYAGGGLAGQCGRSLCASARPVAWAARPKLPGHRSLPDGRGGHLSLSHGPAGRLPWKNHTNAWRPAHIHFSLFGPTWASRLVTQMYFADDPLFGQDPIFNAVPAEAGQRLIGPLRPRGDRARVGAGLALGYCAGRRGCDAV